MLQDSDGPENTVKIETLGTYIHTTECIRFHICFISDVLLQPQPYIYICFCRVFTEEVSFQRKKRQCGKKLDLSPGVMIFWVLSTVGPLVLSVRPKWYSLALLSFFFFNGQCRENPLVALSV